MDARFHRSGTEHRACRLRQGGLSKLLIHSISVFFEVKPKIVVCLYCAVFRHHEKPQLQEKRQFSGGAVKTTCTIGGSTNLYIKFVFFVAFVVICKKVYIPMNIWIVLEHRSVEKKIKKIPNEV